MKVTIDGITYEGTEEEIRRIVENPPQRPPVQINYWDEWGRNIPPPPPNRNPLYTPTPEPPWRDYPIVYCASF